MALLNDEMMQTALNQHIEGDETLEHWAIGIKQPSMFIILPLLLLAVVPGVIATKLLSKTYLIGLTNKRLIALQIKSFVDAELKGISEYPRDSNTANTAKYSSGALFTHISIANAEQPFKCKFANGLTKDNKMHAVAIGKAITNT